MPSIELVDSPFSEQRTWTPSRVSWKTRAQALRGSHSPLDQQTSRIHERQRENPGSAPVGHICIPPCSVSMYTGAPTTCNLFTDHSCSRDSLQGPRKFTYSVFCRSTATSRGASTLVQSPALKTNRTNCRASLFALVLSFFACLTTDRTDYRASFFT